MLTDIPGALFTATATIVAALITAGVSFVNLVTGKEQKTSEFRQQWIDSLREDLSSFCANAQYISTMWAGQLKLDPKIRKNKDKKEKFLESISENTNEMLGVYRRIQLRANPNEHTKLLDIMQYVYEIFDNGKISDVDAMKKKLDELISESQVVLKAEWKRVKKGEPIYRITKGALLFLVLSTAVIAYLYSSNRISIEWNAQHSVPADRPLAGASAKLAR